MLMQDKIKEHLLEHGKIDTLDAAVLYGCFNLPQQAYKLKKKKYGMVIDSRVVSRKVKIQGVSSENEYAEYYVKATFRLSTMDYAYNDEDGELVGSVVSFVFPGLRSAVFGTCFDWNMTAGQVADKLRKLAREIEEVADEKG